MWRIPSFSTPRNLPKGGSSPPFLLSCASLRAQHFSLLLGSTVNPRNTSFLLGFGSRRRLPAQ